MREEEPPPCSFSWRPQEVSSPTTSSKQHQIRLLKAFSRQVLEIIQDRNGMALTENMLQSLALLTGGKRPPSQVPCLEPLVSVCSCVPSSSPTSQCLDNLAVTRHYRPTHPQNPLVSIREDTSPQCPLRWQALEFPSQLDGPWLNSLLFVTVSLALGGWEQNQTSIPDVVSQALPGEG